MRFSKAFTSSISLKSLSSLRAGREAVLVIPISERETPESPEVHCIYSLFGLAGDGPECKEFLEDKAKSCPLPASSDFRFHLS